MIESEALISLSKGYDKVTLTKQRSSHVFKVQSPTLLFEVAIEFL